MLHIDVPRAYFHAKAQRTVPVRVPVEDQTTSPRKAGIVAEGTFTARVTPPASGKSACQTHLKSFEYNLEQTYVAPAQGQHTLSGTLGQASER